MSPVSCRFARMLMMYPRLRCLFGRVHRLLRLAGSEAPLDDAGHFFHEVVEAVLKEVDLAAEMVVSNDCRDGCKQTHGGGDQRLGNARRDHGETGLTDIADRKSGV